MEEFIVTRQAIFDAHCEVVGFELQLENCLTCGAASCNDARKSARLIAHTFMDHGLENLVGSNKAFIKLSHDFFRNAHPIPMASFQLVLEVSGECLQDEQVYRELKQLAQRGYTLSLYDFRQSDVSAERLDCIDIIKLDLAELDSAELKQLSRHYRNHGKRIQVKGVASESQLLLCSQLGIDYTQGAHLLPAEHIPTHSTPCSRSVMQAIAEQALREPTDLASLAHLASHDAVFVYKLLRYLNCASSSERREIHTLEQAIGQIDGNTLGQWASLMVTADAEESGGMMGENGNLRRARRCHQLAKQSANIDPDEAFLAGLLYNLDESMGQPMEALVDAITLSPDITFAICYGEGPLGMLIKSAGVEKTPMDNAAHHHLAKADYTQAS